MSWTTFNDPFCSFVWKHYKRFGRNRPFSDFCAEWRQQLIEKSDPILSTAEWVNCPDDPTPPFTQFDMTVTALQHLRIDGMPHYFVEAGVAEFCSESVDSFAPGYRDERFFRNKPFAVHLRPSHGAASFVVLPVPSPYLFFVLHAASIYTVPENCHYIDSERYVGKLPGWRLLYGLSLYCQAFPECVTEMTDTPMPWLQGPRTFIGKHELVDAEESRCVSPHYRRGHFRVLRHDRFHEPGRVVFVKGTFVKGTAHYVEPIEDAA